MFRENVFRKRSYTFKTFVKDLSIIFANFSQMREVMAKRPISKSFSERIMLAVTMVNGCKYCAFGHVTSALKSGVTEEEIQMIMNADFIDCSQEEMTALLFAQHYAETAGSPSKEALKKLFSYYGPEKAIAILIYIRMVSLGNLLGNSVEAFEARQNGVFVEEGSLLFEIVAYLFAKPIFRRMEKAGMKKLGKNLLSNLSILK